LQKNKACPGARRGSLWRRRRHAVPQARDFSNRWKNPADKIFSVGFFNPLEIFFWLWLVRVG
jgi:hypothetical protein